ncbi:MAG TPA: carboxypeptidase regulatory-like domain-containing protein, partial [Pyrinomonadaceae bacterium]|nr:carboxypeptidase regulatory-like domain-containing protein [Pyrinomonadaceae bacterium]
MKYSRMKFGLMAVCLALLAMPVLIVHSAGGRIEGKVTDPKGAIVVGAQVTVTDPATDRKFTATTDTQGRFKVEGLSAGEYTVTISAPGFSEARRETVKVADGAATTVDIKLEIAGLEAAVTVSGVKANVDPVYQQLRQTGRAEGDFAGPFATVTNLVLKRDAAEFTLRSGEVYFAPPVEGRITAAVFIGEGELTMVPPTKIEKHTLSIFTEQEQIIEPFTRLVIRFTDKTFEEIKTSSNATMGAGGAQAAKARDLYRENQQLLRRQLRDNADIRTLADLYGPQRPGYFTSFIDGKKHGKLIFLLDPLGIPQVSPEEIALLSYGETDRGIWTAFHLADEYAKGTAASSEDHRIFDITHHEIDGTIRGATITANDRVTFRPLVPGRVLAFDLYRTLRVSRVQDSEGKDLPFIQENKDEDADFAVIMPETLQVGKDYTLTVQYAGSDALRDSGGGNYFLIPRSTWYPNNSGTQFGDRARFDYTFRYPKGFTFVGTGAPVEPDKRDGDVMIAKWSSGNTDLAVAGFNYGRFKKKEFADKETGYNIEFYANEELPDEVRAMQHNIERAESAGINTMTTLGSISTTAMADSALADAENSTRIYNAYFGKLPYTRLAMTQQPAGNFGQAWPTLVFMPYTAFIDTTQRAQMMGTQAGTDTFWRYVAPHEIAHQWWGHIIGWDSYHDQWMSEGFAEFSASLYVQFVRRDITKFNDFWNNQRDLITTARPQTRDLKPYTVGPVTQGYRLNSAKTGGVARFMIYPKGAYILHMLRMMFYVHGEGDKRFQEMMKDFVQTYFNRDISTEDFKRAVEKHMTKEMDLDGNQRLDWFFNEWVYGTEMPSYKFEYQLGPTGTTLSGRITQSGVSDNFKMLVPIYLD